MPVACAFEIDLELAKEAVVVVGLDGVRWTINFRGVAKMTSSRIEHP
jgi:hypothetical protein